MCRAMTIVGVSAVLCAAGLRDVGAAQTLDAKQLALEREAAAVTVQIEDVGREIHFHAEQLITLANESLVGSLTHYHHLAAVKTLVNERLTPAVTRLTELQSSLPDWKQESIERMLIAARGVGADASAALLVKTTNPTLMPRLNASYLQFLKDVSQHASTLQSTAEAAHKYASAHLRALEAGLPVRK